MPLGFNRQSCTGFSPSMTAFSKAFHLTLSCHVRGPTTPVSPRDMGLGSSAFARHYLRNHCLFSPPMVLRCFSSPRSPPLRMAGLQPAGLPHSDIPGSRAICASPGLFAAYHVLHRLREPRHPPSALAYFLSPRT